MSKTTTKGRPVIVCTNLRGIFFGYAEDTSGETIKLTGARNAWYWKCDAGFMQLAETGPQKGSKVGARADMELRGISCVLEVSPKAVDAWESASWGK